MSSQDEQSNARSIDRREFFGIGLKTAAAFAALPAASLVLTACGSGDESGESAAPAAQPGAAPPKPQAPAPPKPQAPAPPKPQAAAPPKPAPSPAPAQGGDAQLVTEIAAAGPMVSSLQYVNESPKAEQNCATCQLYTAGEGGRGKCQLFAQGLVKEKGWCISWAPRVS